MFFAPPKQVQKQNKAGRETGRGASVFALSARPSFSRSPRPPTANDPARLRKGGVEEGGSQGHGRRRYRSGERAPWTSRALARNKRLRPSLLDPREFVHGYEVNGAWEEAVADPRRGASCGDRRRSRSRGPSRPACCSRMPKSPGRGFFGLCSDLCGCVEMGSPQPVEGWPADRGGGGGGGSRGERVGERTVHSGVGVAGTLGSGGRPVRPGGRPDRITPCQVV